MFQSHLFVAFQFALLQSSLFQTIVHLFLTFHIANLKICAVFPHATHAVLNFFVFLSIIIDDSEPVAVTETIQRINQGI